MTWLLLGILFFMALPLALLAEVLRCFYLEHRGDRIPILLYHRLLSKADADAGRVPDNEMIYVSYDTRFAEQMRYLHDAGYTTLDFDDYLKIRAGTMRAPPKPVIVTFDDGYLSNYTMAFPALRANGQKAVIYVAPEPDDYTRKLVEGVDGFLSPEQMRELAANGVAIQSHTLTHCVLSELDEARAMHELTESRRRLQEITGRPVEHIAIPRSGYSRRVRRLVEAAGYRTCCCNNKGSTNLQSDPLSLPRFVIERDMSIEDFKHCLRPRTAAVLRIIGNLKRIPERIGGSSFATKLRNLLYVGPLQVLFRTRNLKRLIVVGGLAYLAGCVAFFWHLLSLGCCECG